eukprot:15468480-Alexandrium_andersonii.AAC.1
MAPCGASRGPWPGRAEQLRQLSTPRPSARPPCAEVRPEAPARGKQCRVGGRSNSAKAGRCALSAWPPVQAPNESYLRRQHSRWPSRRGRTGRSRMPPLRTRRRARRG